MLRSKTGKHGRTIICSFLRLMPGVAPRLPCQPAGENETVNVFLNGLNENCKFISVVVANKGRQMLYKYCTFAIDDPETEYMYWI